MKNICEVLVSGVAEWDKVKRGFTSVLLKRIWSLLWPIFKAAEKIKRVSMGVFSVHGAEVV